jgi:cell division septal protein FtsQ
MRKRHGANQRRNQAAKRSRPATGHTVAKRRLPAVVTWVLLAAIIGGAGYFAARIAVSSPHLLGRMVLRHVDLHGVNRLDSAAVLKAAKLTMGQPLTGVDVGAIAKRVRTLCWVRSVSVHRRLPDGLVMRIKEREPIAFVNLGAIFLTDTEGMLLPLPARTCLNMPVVSGLRDTIAGKQRRLTPGSVERMNRFFAESRSTGLAVARMISQVSFNRRGAILCKLSGGRASIELAESDVPRGLRRLAQIVDRIEEEKWAAPRSINLCYSSVAYVSNGGNQDQ